MFSGLHAVSGAARTPGRGTYLRFLTAGRRLERKHMSVLSRRSSGRVATGWRRESSRLLRCELGRAGGDDILLLGLEAGDAVPEVERGDEGPDVGDLPAGG